MSTLNGLWSPRLWLLLLLAGASAACTPSYVTISSSNVKLNADSLRRAWSSLPRDSIHSYLRLGTGAGCNNCKVPVTIQGIAGNERFNPNHPPTDPQPVAHVVNSGAYATEMYGFKPDNEAYFVVSADSAGDAVWGIVQFSKRAGSVTFTRGKKVTPCLPSHPPGRSNADFQTCEGAHHTVMVRGGVLTLAARGMEWLIARGMNFSGEDPAWFSCNTGCCTMAM